LPSKYGKCNSVYKKFRQWASAGIFETLIHFKTKCGEILALDSSRGGKTTKIHVLILVALSFLHDVNLKNKAVLADKAYSISKIRDYLEKQEALVCIPDKINAKAKHDFDRELYKKRNVVERFFCRLKDYLRITIRLDKLSSSFRSCLQR